MFKRSRTSLLLGVILLAIVFAIPATVLAQPAREDGSKVYAISYLSDSQFMLSIEFPSPVSGNYSGIASLLADETKQAPLKCFTVADYPNRLYCTGERGILPEGFKIVVKIFSDDTNGEFFNGQSYLPATPTPRPPVIKEKDPCIDNRGIVAQDICYDGCCAQSLICCDR